jgi:hypothetical protein
VGFADEMDLRTEEEKDSEILASQLHGRKLA